MYVKRSKGPPPHQIKAEKFQTYMLVYRHFLTEIAYLFWDSETWKIAFKIFAYFPFQKLASQKQCEITTKNLPYFSYQKINV